jgi:hypothetical protein
MAVNQKMGYSLGGYPTGVSPMAFDFSQEVGALTQRMVKKEQQRLKQEGDAISGNEEMILKALDFKTVQGMSDRGQQKHIENLDNLWKKWADRFAKTGGKLSMQDRSELMQDKRKVEGDLATMQANVKQVAEVQKLLQQSAKYPWLDADKTAKNLVDFADKNDIAGSGADILAYTQYTANELIDEKYADDKKWVARQIEESITPGSTKSGILSSQKSNIQAVEKMWKTVYNDPILGPKIDKEGVDVVKEKFFNSWGSNLKSERFSATAYNAANPKSSGKSTYRADLYPGLSYAQGYAMNDFNPTVDGIAKLDQSSLDELKGYSIPELGNTAPAAIFVKKTSGGGYKIELANKGDTKRTELLIPKATMTQAEFLKVKKAWAEKLYKWKFGTSGNVKNPGSYIHNATPLGKGIVIPDIAQKEGLINLVDETGDYAKGAEKDPGKLSDRTNKIAEVLKVAFPDDTISVAKKSGWLQGEKEIKWGKDSFDLSTPEGKKSLKEKINDNSRAVITITGGEEEAETATDEPVGEPNSGTATPTLFK